MSKYESLFVLKPLIEISKWGSRDKYLKDIHIPYMELPDSYRPEAFKEDYENALIFKKLLDEFRTYGPMSRFSAS